MNIVLSEKEYQEFVREHSKDEITCVKCGSSDFNLIRTVPEQIVIICKNCDHPHLLNADELNGQPVITFWTEAEEP